MERIRVGGAVDKTDVCLAVYGEDLDPADVTRVLGCEPTSAHRRGDRMKRGTLRRTGAWLLSVRGTVSPEEVTVALLDRLPADEEMWRDLARRYDLQLRYGLFLDRWNRGVTLSPTLVFRIARLHAVVGFDIYGPDGEVDVVGEP
jgi:hypothetical protein